MKLHKKYLKKDGSLGSMGNGLMFPLFGLLLSTNIKIFFEPPHKLKKDTEFWALMMVLLGLGSFVAQPVQNFFFGIAGERLIRRIRSLTFKKVVHQEISWFDDPANSSGAVRARLSTDAATVSFALTMSATGVSQTSGTAPDVNKVKYSAASIFELLDSKPIIDSSSDKVITLASVSGEIEFRHVSFKYPTRPDIQIFRDLCLSIPSGKCACDDHDGSGLTGLSSVIKTDIFFLNLINLAD